MSAKTQSNQSIHLSQKGKMTPGLACKNAIQTSKATMASLSVQKQQTKINTEGGSRIPLQPTPRRPRISGLRKAVYRKRPVAQPIGSAVESIATKTPTPSTSGVKKQTTSSPIKHLGKCGHPTTFRLAATKMGWMMPKTKPIDTPIVAAVKTPKQPKYTEAYQEPSKQDLLDQFCMYEEVPAARNDTQFCVNMQPFYMEDFRHQKMPALSQHQKELLKKIKKDCFFEVQSYNFVPGTCGTTILSFATKNPSTCIPFRHAGSMIDTISQIREDDYLNFAKFAKHRTSKCFTKRTTDSAYWMLQTTPEKQASTVAEETADSTSGKGETTDTGDIFVYPKPIGPENIKKGTVIGFFKNPKHQMVKEPKFHKITKQMDDYFIHQALLMTNKGEFAQFEQEELQKSAEDISAEKYTRYILTQQMRDQWSNKPTVASQIFEMSQHMYIKHRRYVLGTKQQVKQWFAIQHQQNLLNNTEQLVEKRPVKEGAVIDMLSAVSNYVKSNCTDVKFDILQFCTSLVGMISGGIATKQAELKTAPTITTICHIINLVTILFKAYLKPDQHQSAVSSFTAVFETWMNKTFAPVNTSTIPRPSKIYSPGQRIKQDIESIELTPSQQQPVLTDTQIASLDAVIHDVEVELTPPVVEPEWKKTSENSTRAIKLAPQLETIEENLSRKDIEEMPDSETQAILLDPTTSPPKVEETVKEEPEATPEDDLVQRVLTKELEAIDAINEVEHEMAKVMEAPPTYAQVTIAPPPEKEEEEEEYDVCMCMKKYCNFIDSIPKKFTDSLKKTFVDFFEIVLSCEDKKCDHLDKTCWDVFCFECQLQLPFKEDSDMIMQFIIEKVFTQSNYDVFESNEEFWVLYEQSYNNAIQDGRIKIKYPSKMEDPKTNVKQMEISSPATTIDGSTVVRGIIAVVVFLASAILVVKGYKDAPDFTKYTKLTLDFMYSLYHKGVVSLEQIYKKIATMIWPESETPTQVYDSLMSDSIIQLSNYRSTPMVDMATNYKKIYDYEQLIKSSREKLSTCGRDGSPHIKSALTKECELGGSRLAELKEIYKTNLNRVVPTCHLIYGPPGIGKTRALIEITNRIKQQHFPEDAGTYVIGGDKYFPPYAGQHIARKEEAFNQKDLNDDPFVRQFNTIVSNGFANLEGAFEKLQPCQFESIWLDTNRTPEEIARLLPFDTEASRAVMSRMVYWQAEWANGNNILTGHRGINQGHKEDFSHIRFVPYRLVVTGQDSSCKFEKCAIQINVKKGDGFVPQRCEHLSMDDLIGYDKWLRDQYLLNAKKLLDDNRTHIENIENRAKLQHEAQNNVKQLASNSMVVNITGSSGSGKSSGLVNSLIQRFKAIYKIPRVIQITAENISTYTKTLTPSSSPILVVVDDLVKTTDNNMDAIENADEYCRLYDTLPNGSLVIFVSNIRKQAKWLPKVFPYTMTFAPKYYSIFKDESKYRRMGYTGIFETQYGDLVVPTTNNEYVVENYNIYHNNKQLSENEAIDQIFDNWRTYLMRAGDVIVKDVLTPEYENHYDFIIRFNSLERLKNVCASPLKVTAYLSGNDTTGETVFASPTIFEAIRAIPTQEFQYAGSMNNQRDLVELGKHYIRVMRRNNIQATALIEIPNYLTASINGIVCNVCWYSASETTNYKASVIYDSYHQNLEICCNGHLTFISLQQYESWFVQENKNDIELAKIDHRVIYLLNSTPMSQLLHKMYWDEFVRDLAEQHRKCAEQKRSSYITTKATEILKFLRTYSIWAVLLGVITMCSLYYANTNGEKEEPTDEEAIQEEYKKIAIDKFSKLSKDQKEVFLTQIFGGLCKEHNTYKCTEEQCVQEYGTPPEDRKPSDNYRGPATYQPKPGTKITSANRGVIAPRDNWGDYISPTGNWADELDEFYEMRQAFAQRSNAREMVNVADWNTPPNNTVESLWKSHIRGNLIKVTGKDGIIFQLLTRETGSLFGLGLCSRFFLAPRHVIGNVNYLEISDDRYHSGTRTPAVVLKVFADIDLCLCWVIAKDFPSFKDITKKIPHSRQDRVRVGERVTFCVQRKKELVMHSASVAQYFETPVALFSENEGLKDTCKVMHKGVLEHVSYFGDCGSVYINERRAVHGEPSIMGLHIGASKDASVGRTYFSCTYMEDFIPTMQAFMKDDGPSKVIDKLKEGYNKVPLPNPEAKPEQAIREMLQIQGKDASGEFIIIDEGSKLEEKIYVTPEEKNLLLRANNNLAQKSILPHISYPDKGDVEVIGTLEGVCQIPYTKYIPTRVTDLATEIGIHSIKGPTWQPWQIPEEDRLKLDKDEEGKPCIMTTQTRLYSGELPKMSNYMCAKIAKDWAKPFAAIFGKSLQVCSDEMVLNGAHYDHALVRTNTISEGTFAPLELDKSCGGTLAKLFRVTKKSHCIDMDRDTGKRRFSRKNEASIYVEKRYKAGVSLLCQGKRPFTAYKTAVKQEHLVKRWKARTFECSDLLSVLFERKFLGLFVANNIRATTNQSCRLGVDPIVDFNTIAQYHLKKEAHFSCDFSRWDKRVSRQLFAIITQVFRQAHQIVKPHNGQPCKWCNGMAIVIKNLWHSIHFVATNVNIKRRGMPSGSFLTTPINSMINECVFYIAYLAIFTERVHSWDDYKQLIHISTCGDDAIVSVNMDIVDRYNLETVSKVLHTEVGMILDSMDKDGALVPYVTDFEDVKFVSRKFVRLNKDENLWTGALKKESINTRLHYIARKYSDDEELIHLLNSAYFEAALWDSEYFSLFEKFHISLVQREPSLSGQLSLLSQEQIRRLYTLGIKTETYAFKPSNVNENSVNVLKDKDIEIFKLTMASFKVNREWPNTIAAMNELMQSGWPISKRDESFADGKDWVHKVTVTYSANGDSQTQTAEGRSTNRTRAKHLAYDEIFRYLKSKVLIRDRSAYSRLTVDECAKLLKVASSSGLPMKPSFVARELDWSLVWSKLEDQTKIEEIIINANSERLPSALRGDFEADWGYALNNHVNNSMHHPESTCTTENTFMSYNGTLECLCDLWACAMRQPQPTTPIEALQLVYSWLVDEEDLVRRKFQSLDVEAFTQFVVTIQQIKNLDVEIPRHIKVAHAKETTGGMSFHVLANFTRSYLDYAMNRGLNTESWQYYFDVYTENLYYHCNMVNGLCGTIFNLNTTHDYDKWQYDSLMPYIWKFIFERHERKLDQARQSSNIDWNTFCEPRQVLELDNISENVRQMDKQNEFVQGGPTVDTGMGTTGEAAPVDPGVSTMPAAALESANQIDTLGLNYSGVFDFNSPPTQTDLTGQPIHWNRAATMCSISAGHEDFVLDSKSKPGDHIFTLTCDPDKLQGDAKAWAASHKYVDKMEMIYKFTVYGCENIIGSYDLIWNPYALKGTSATWQALRASNKRETVTIAGTIKNATIISDVFNVGRTRTYDTTFDKNGVVKITSDQPWPCIEGFVSHQIINRYAPTSEFSITIRVDKWLSPRTTFLGPRENTGLACINLTPTAPKPTSYSNAQYNLPHSEETITIFNQTENRMPRSIYTGEQDILHFPPIEGLCPTQDVDVKGEIPKENIFDTFPVLWFSGEERPYNTEWDIMYKQLLEMSYSMSMVITGDIHRNTLNNLHYAFNQAINTIWYYDMTTSEAVENALYATLKDVDMITSIMPTTLVDNLERLHPREIDHIVNMQSRVLQNVAGTIDSALPPEANNKPNIWNAYTITDKQYTCTVMLIGPPNKKLFRKHVSVVKKFGDRNNKYLGSINFTDQFKLANTNEHTFGYTCYWHKHEHSEQRDKKNNITFDGNFDYSKFMPSMWLESNSDNYDQRYDLVELKLKDSWYKRGIASMLTPDPWNPYPTYAGIMGPTPKDIFNSSSGYRLAGKDLVPYISVFSTVLKKNQRDGRKSAVRFGQTSYVVLDPLDMEQIPFDSYGTKMESLGREICKNIGADSFNCDLRMGDNTIIAYLNFSLQFGWGLIGTRQQCALTAIDTRSAILDNIQPNMFVPRQTNTNDWVPYYSTGYETNVREAALVAGMVGSSALGGLFNGLAQGLGAMQQQKYNKELIALNNTNDLLLQKKNFGYSQLLLGQRIRGNKEQITQIGQNMRDLDMQRFNNSLYLRGVVGNNVGRASAQPMSTTKTQSVDSQTEPRPLTRNAQTNTSIRSNSSRTSSINSMRSSVSDISISSDIFRGIPTPFEQAKQLPGFEMEELNPLRLKSSQENIGIYQTAF